MATGRRWHDRARYLQFVAHRPPSADTSVIMSADDASLLGTSQSRLYIGREQIGSYFRGTSTAKFGERHFVGLSEDSVPCVGKYTFTRRQGGHPAAVRARFTFVARHRSGVLQILHHHSSAEPG
jgi:hypothetical protein